MQLYKDHSSSGSEAFIMKLAQKKMRFPESPSSLFLALLLLLLLVASIAETHGKPIADTINCTNSGSPCFDQTFTCPDECPLVQPKNQGKKACSVNCNPPLCQTQCISIKPNCNSPGAACQDPRFIGGDGTVFYFHGKRNEHFNLVSDLNLQINARFIGLRPAGRPRDFTWIQALGILFDSHAFSVEATKATSWDDEVDHLKFSFDGMDLEIPEGYPSAWEYRGNAIKVERSSSKNSAIITLPQVATISVNVVPVTKEDDRIHKYHIPSDDCFAHLEVQFRFLGLSSKVEGVLGRTYQPDFVSPAKPGVAMPVVGGEDKYRTTSLLSADCKHCVFSAAGVLSEEGSGFMNYGALDCTGSSSGGYGIVCRK